MTGSTNHVAYKKQESQRIKNCYNCDEFEMHHRGILCKVDGIVRDKEVALIGCKSHTPVPSSERAACSYSCDFLVSRNCKWECSHEGGRKETICIDTEYCNFYSNVESVEGEESSSVEKFKKELRAVLDDDFNFLVEKNRQYGDSALDPLRIFSKSSTKEQILVRMDDKLSRIKRGDAKIEDTFRDLRNYMHLLEVLERRERAEGEKK